MTTETLMIRAIERGLTLRDFDEMTPGMVIGYIIAYNNERLNEDEKEDQVIMATQSHFDSF